MYKFAFTLSHDNKSKNYQIVMKFGTYVAFIYLIFRSRLLAKKIDVLRKKIFEIKN